MNAGDVQISAATRTGPDRMLESIATAGAGQVVDGLAGSLALNLVSGTTEASLADNATLVSSTDLAIV